MIESLPLVSIGMPTYNGARFLRRSLESLLALKYAHFELIISDNGSTDETQSICEEFVKRDDRITYHRNPVNRGALWNFNHVFSLSKGSYFMWASDHDLWEPNFLSACVATLDQNPDTVLAFGRWKWIDADGNVFGEMDKLHDTRGLNRVQRYKHVLWSLGWCTIFYGLFRRKALLQVGPCQEVWGSDILMLATISLLGSFAHVDETLFYRRQNRSPEKEQTRKERILAVTQPLRREKRKRISMATLNKELRNAHLRMLFRMPMNIVEKIECAYSTFEAFSTIHRVRSLCSFVLQTMRKSLSNRLTWFSRGRLAGPKDVAYARESRCQWHN